MTEPIRSYRDVSCLNIIPHSFPCLPLLGLQIHSIPSNKHLLSASMCQALLVTEDIMVRKSPVRSVPSGGKAGSK